MTENPYAAPAFDPRASSDLTELMPILQGVQWPLRMSFKVLTFAPTVRIHDATGRLVIMVRQKFFKLREHVEIFADEQRTQKVAEIRANKIIDWSARYNFTEPDGRPIGSTQRQGMRSLWRASYDVYNPGDETPDFHIRETNPMAKFFDGLVGSIPAADAEDTAALVDSYQHICKLRDEVIAAGVLPPMGEWSNTSRNEASL